MKLAYIWVSGQQHLDAKRQFTQEYSWVLKLQEKKIQIRYMDFWKVENGKITDNWVMVDFPHVLAQLGVDVFNGHGWEAFDDGTKIPPKIGSN